LRFHALIPVHVVDSVAESSTPRSAIHEPASTLWVSNRPPRLSTSPVRPPSHTPLRTPPQICRSATDRAVAASPSPKRAALRDALSSGNPSGERGSSQNAPTPPCAAD